MIKSFRDSEIVSSFDHKYKVKVLEFIEFLYAKDSILMAVEDMEDRRRQAAHLAGMDPDKEEIKKIIEFMDEKVNDLAFHFMCTNNSNRFNNLLNAQNLLWSYQKMLSKPFPENDEEAQKAVTFRSKLSDECDAQTERIDRLMSEIFPKEIKEKAEDNIRKMYSLEGRLKEKLGKAG
jgi:archaellum component FlaC